MNERIKKLAIDAGEYTNSVYQPPIRSKTPGKIWEDGHIGWDEIFNQKFAHLIVQECANLLVKEAKSSHDEGSETYDTLIRESNWMKRYFGVTE